MLNKTSFNYTNLTQGEQEAYNSYKKEAYNLNKALRIRAGLTNKQQSHVAALDNLIHSHSIAKPMTLYRATCQDCVYPFIKQNTYAYPAYLSTAEQPKQIQQHTSCVIGNPIVLIIHCPTGTNMIPMDENPSHGHTEGEWLLGKGLTFKIIKRDVAISPPDVLKWLGSLYSTGINALEIYTLQL